MREWRKTHPLTLEQKMKDSARSQVSVYVKRGKIAKPSGCSKCGSGLKIEAHHNDYSKPREVVWICRVCHLQSHKKQEAE